MIEFDFDARIDRPVSVDQVAASLAAGKSVWAAIDLSGDADVTIDLAELSVNARVIESLMSAPAAGRYDVYDDCLHLAVGIPQFAGRAVVFQVIDVVLMDRLIITLHRGESLFVNQLQATYPKFFRTFALSIGFLLFEIWDSVLESHRRLLNIVEDDVERAQKSVFSDTGDEIFENVSRLTSSVLDVRKSTLAMRGVVEQLATHKSTFVPTTTQPYLQNMVGSFDRLASDLTVERETLAEALTLYLGVVAHRTNQLLHRLTLVSLVFLPLTFLCGVYGMNFELAEYGWRYGPQFFWSLVIVVVAGMVAWMRVRKMW